MTYYLVGGETPGFYNLVGLETPEGAIGVKEILQRYIDTVCGQEAFSEIEVSDVGSNVYATIGFNIYGAAPDNYVMLDMADSACWSAIEYELVSRFLEYSNEGIREFSVEDTYSDSIVLKTDMVTKVAHNGRCIVQNVQGVASSLGHVGASDDAGTYTSVFVSSETSVESNKGEDPGASRPILYYKQEGDTKYIYAVRYNSYSPAAHEEQQYYISVVDIVRNPATADFVASLADGQVHLFAEMSVSNGKLVCRPVMTNNFLNSSAVTVVNLENAVGGLDAEVQRHLEDSFNSVLQGITVNICVESVTLPQVVDCSLAHLKPHNSPSDARELYNKMYNLANPTTTNAIQSFPDSVLSLAIPAYKNVKDVYASKITAESDADDVENPTVDIIPTYDSLNIQITPEVIPITHDYIGSFDFHDCIFYKEAALIVKPEEKDRYIALIEGSVENNDNPVTEKELSVYLALRNLLVYDICTEKNLYTLAEINKALVLGVRGTITDKLMSDMLYDAYKLNWSHTGDIFDLDSISSSNDEDDDSADTVTSSYNCFYHVRAERTSDNKTKFVKILNESEMNNEALLNRYQSRVSGIILLKQQVATNVINSFAYIDAVIRLLRWGELKPSYIYIPSYVNTESGLKEKTERQYVNLIDRTVSNFSGIWKSTDRVVFGDDAYYLIDGQIEMTAANDYTRPTFSAELSSGSSILCGMALLSYYGSTDSSQTDFIDIFTLATGISSGAIKVFGIDYDKETKTFNLNGKQSDKASGYNPQEKFGRVYNILDVRESPSGAQQEHRIICYKSTYLLKAYKEISHLLPKLDNKSYPSIFEILKDSRTELNPEVLQACTQALTDPGATSKDISALLRKLIIAEKGLLINAFVQSVTNRFLEFQNAFSATSGTLTDALNTALQIEIAFSQKSSSVTQTTAVRMSAADYIRNGLEEYSRLVTADGELTLGHIGQKDSHLIVWLPTEFTELNSPGGRLNLQAFGRKLNSISAGSETVWSIIAGAFSGKDKLRQASCLDKLNKLTNSFFVESHPGALKEIIVAMQRDMASRQGKQ